MSYKWRHYTSERGRALYKYGKRRGGKVVGRKVNFVRGYTRSARARKTKPKRGTFA